jgi:hypothetical protein
MDGYGYAAGGIYGILAYLGDRAPPFLQGFIGGIAAGFTFYLLSKVTRLWNQRKNNGKNGNAKT